MAVFIRPQAKVLRKRLAEARRFVQVITGPRQSGNTTLVRGVGESLGVPVRYASADEPTLRDRGWIDEQWNAARAEAGEEGRPGRGAGAGSTDFLAKPVEHWVAGV